MIVKQPQIVYLMKRFFFFQMELGIEKERGAIGQDTSSKRWK